MLNRASARNCRIFAKAICSVLDQSQPTGNQTFTELNVEICEGITGAVIAAGDGFPALGGAAIEGKPGATAGVGLKALDAVCLASTPITSVIDFFNDLPVDVQVSASLNGVSLKQTQTNQPVSGPFQSVALDFPCATVDHVAVSPTATSVPAAEQVNLTATPMDANNKILQSSGFDIAWNSSNESIATVEASGIPVPGGIALLPGASQVTGVATGQASITAEEQTSGKSGSSQVTVTPQLVSVYGFLFFANGVGTLQLTVNGQALGTDNNISTDPLDAFQICDVPVGSGTRLCIQFNWNGRSHFSTRKCIFHHYLHSYRALFSFARCKFWYLYSNRYMRRLPGVLYYASDLLHLCAMYYLPSAQCSDRTENSVNVVSISEGNVFRRRCQCHLCRSTPAPTL